MPRLPSLPDYALVKGDGWQGFYIAGFLACEDHNLSAEDILDALRLPMETWEVDQDWIDDEGRLPRKLQDVKRADP